jgi:hypothetical protein
MNIYIELLDKILDALESHIEVVKVFAYRLNKFIRGTGCANGGENEG